jgi:hypothetical protein
MTSSVAVFSRVSLAFEARVVPRGAVSEPLLDCRRRALAQIPGFDRLSTGEVVNRLEINRHRAWKDSTHTVDRGQSVAVGWLETCDQHTVAEELRSGVEDRLAGGQIPGGQLRCSAQHDQHLAHE